MILGNNFPITKKCFDYCILIIVWLLFLVSWSFAADPFSFVVFGDNQDGEETFSRLIDKVNKEEGIVFAVNTGDFVLNGTEPEYTAYIKKIARLKVKTYNVPGNHDMQKHGYLFYKKYFGPSYYAFDYKNAHFVILDNAFKESFTARQFAWLKDDLASAKKEHIFVFMHRPTFDPTEIYAGYIMSGRKTVEEVMALFKRNKVDYVFAGHIHGYAKAEREGTVYIVTGGAGAPLHLPRDIGGFNHYVRITVDGDKVKEKVVKIYE